MVRPRSRADDRRDLRPVAGGARRDVGRDPTDPNARIYRTNKRQNYHTDSVDFVLLLCLNKPREGGLGALVSSVTAFNEFRARRPDLLPAMFEPFPTDRRGEVLAGMAPFFSIPIFTWYEGRLTTMYWPEPERRRHLLRLWLCPPDGRPLPPYFAPRYGSVTIGDHGGIVVPGTKLHAPLDG